MNFVSLAFLLFALVFFGLWPLLRRPPTLRYLFLIAASSVFYGFWDWRYLFCMLGLGIVHFTVAGQIEKRPRLKTPLLVVSISASIGLLATFKYLGFFTQNLNSILEWMGWGGDLPVPKFPLPVGISFFTFQSLSYTLDVHAGRMKPTRSFLHFFAYMMLFPHLVAGPIIRAIDLLPQMEQARPPSEPERWEGLVFILSGFFKKAVLADNLAPAVNTAFEGMTGGGLFWWIVMLMFAWQIYCDFSGYTDIAIGLGRFMGYHFPDNFRHPYLARGLSDFWRRWHISLSSWFRDYVYIPLGGNKKGRLRTHVNTWVTMLLSGLWHGANWTFVAWGGLHALYLTIERSTRWPDRLRRLPLGTLLTILLVLPQVVAAWVFFRAETFDQAWRIFSAMFTPEGFWPEKGLGIATWPLIVLGGAAAGEILYALLQIHPSARERPWLRALQPVGLALLALGGIVLRGAGGDFIYFQF